MGDLLLTQVAGRIRDNLRPSDLPARLGGDEFAVLLIEVTTEEIDAVVARLDEAIRSPVRAGGVVLRVDVSIGVTTSDQEHANADEVLRDADAAMYRHKRRNRRPGPARRRDDVADRR